MTDLDRYLDAFGAELRAAEPPRPKRGLALGAALVVTTAVAIVALLLAPGGGGGAARPGPVDAIAAARKALDPTGVILHMRVRTEMPNRQRTRFFEERWSAQEPARWRMRMWTERGVAQQREPAELAYGGGERSYYHRHRLAIEQGFKDDTPQTRLPTIFSRSGGDPDTDLRALLTSGGLTDEGEQQAGGRTVRRLTLKDGFRRIVFDVDPATFVPLGGSSTLLPARGNSAAMTATFVVEAFERLPINAETEKLLKITPPAGTRTTRSG